ncbi:calmodulin-like myosin-light chain [Chrysochromulina tobinii]|uniref:Calmodulin-like myosin-light chain n=1 Tax=Chrysochromulina tobinii TaxID=1460289 RepID=A0A0M0K4S7_9EUKA|nr:calmodulin-like myosin-light chain [Chrysochromulina tobinii]|eukprot:KOO33825.1 calmodulin-like myosin-light chain [Chrysochromulina sp. CCMP291]
MASSNVEDLLRALEERASTARTIFMLLDSDADGLVAVEQLSSMLTSMLLSQSLNYDGDVEEFVLQMTRYRRLTKVTYSDFVDFYNALVDRIKLRQCMSSMGSGGGTAASSHLTSSGADAMGASGASSSESGRDVAAPTASASASIAQLKRRNFSGSAYLVSGAALKAVNGVYTQSGESDGVPKYTYKGAGGVQYSLLRRSVSGGRFWYIAESFAQPAPGPPAKEATGAAAPKCFFCLRSNAGTPPLEMPWERAKDGVLPGPFLTPISLTHAPPTSVLAPLTTFEIGDFVRANWAGRGVMYPGEVLAINHEDETLDILYDDGDFESHVPRQRVHPVSIELTDAFHAFGVGDVVKADLKGHGSWYTGRIIAIDTKFRVFTIKYENGHLEKHVPPSRVQPMSTGHIKQDYVHGERVRANWQSCGTWCLGRICSVNHSEGTFNVQYDDGEIELHVAAHSLQPAEDADFKAAEAEPLPFACTLVSKASGGFGSSSGLGSSSLGYGSLAR